jgi:photosystem II stability/assembly factor-like uncharacterized protein
MRDEKFMLAEKQVNRKHALNVLCLLLLLSFASCEQPVWSQDSIAVAQDASTNTGEEKKAVPHEPTLPAAKIEKSFGDDPADQKKRQLAGPFYNLEYRLIGPAASGRVARVAGVPGDPSTYWAATAAGGIWKSVNGGLNWESVFDEQAISSTGSIAIAPSDPNVVWVGSGEANIRGNVGEGNGIYRSTDAGKNWAHVWKSEGQIGTIIVHPTDPDIAYAAVLGSPFGPGENRGVYRSTDGGKSWERVLFVDVDTGASDVCFDPSNPRILFAGTWQTRRTPWSYTSGGPGGGLWMSRDSGDTWSRLQSKGLPDGIWGRVGVRVSRTDSNRIYALIEAEQGGLFRSDDGGDSWELVNASRGIRQRAWYYTTLTIDPDNADVVWFPQVHLLKTIDGGEDIRAAKGGGWDYHDVWIDPADSNRMIIGSDAGVSLSSDGGKTWTRPPLPISQFYHVNVDTRNPYRVLGSLQDFGTASGPSNSLAGAGILLSDWYNVGGGEAGHVVADPSDPNIVWAGEYLGYISRWDGRTGQAPHVGIYPDSGSGHGAEDLRYRFQWTAPILISPHDHNTVYHAGNVLFRTTDGGQNWSAISPDLSRNDKSKQQWAGGPITGDNTGVEIYGTIFAIDESILEPGVLWAGTDDGLVHCSRDAGQNWNQVTPPDLPEWTTVVCVQASRHNRGTAYLVAEGHRLDDETPYLWKTTDYGKNWIRLGMGSLTGSLDPEIYLHVVREDPQLPGLLYLGTERGVMFSRDDGVTWQSLRLNMPTVAISDLVVAKNDLVVATCGRSAWILDDLTPVREMTPAIMQSTSFLFPIPPAVRWLGGEETLGSHDGAGANPPDGVEVTYWLSSKPSQPVTLEVVDSAGNLVRKLGSELEPQYTDKNHPDFDPTIELKPDLPTEPGLNRATWDMTYTRTQWVPGTRNDGGAPLPGPRVLPGEYELRLEVDGNVHSQKVRIEPDPRVEYAADRMRAQIEFRLKVRDQMNRIVDTVNNIRSIRHQISEHQSSLGSAKEVTELLSNGKRLSDAMFAIEQQLHNPAAEVDYDVLAGREGGAKLYSRLAWLASSAAEHEGPPTQGMTEVADTVDKEYQRLAADFSRLVSGDLAKLNAQAKELGVPFVVQPARQDSSAN